MGTQEHWTAAQYQEYLRQRAKGENKYHAVKAQTDGRTYDSRSECKRAKDPGRGRRIPKRAPGDL